MSDTFDHYFEAMESFLDGSYIDYGDYGDPDIDSYDYYKTPKSKNNKKKLVDSNIPITHFGKNLISEMTESHLENSIKFIIQNNNSLNDYHKELIKIMTSRLSTLKYGKSTKSCTIIDNNTGEIIFEF